MKAGFASLFLFVAVAVGQTLQINTPSNAVECEPTLFSWSGGTPPYFLSILPGNQPGAAALENLGQQSGTSLTWTTDIASGTSIGLTLRDSTGATAQSAAFTIQPGSSSSCVGKGSSQSSGGSSTPAGSSSSSVAAGGGSTSTPAASSSSSSVSTPVATTPATTKATTSAGGTSTTATSTGAAAATTSAAPNGAMSNAANMGLAAVVGAAAMAILA